MDRKATERVYAGGKDIERVEDGRGKGMGMTQESRWA